jgi:hypothetical protein
MFKAAEVGNRDRDIIQAMEADKDDRLEHASRLEEVLSVLDKLQKKHSNDHTKLRGPEFEVLL